MHQDEYGREIRTDLKYVMQQADWSIKCCTSVGQIYMFHTLHNIFYFMHQDECGREIGTYSKYVMQLAD